MVRGETEPVGAKFWTLETMRRAASATAAASTKSQVSLRKTDFGFGPLLDILQSPPVAHAPGHGDMGRPPAPIGVVDGETIYKGGCRCAVCVGKALSQARQTRSEIPYRAHQGWSVGLPQGTTTEHTHKFLELQNQENELQHGLGHHHSRENSSQEDLGEEGWDIDALPVHEEVAQSLPIGMMKRKRGAALKEPIKSPEQLMDLCGGVPKKKPNTIRGQWSDETLQLAIEGLDQGYKTSQVCAKYGIPRASLKDHLVGTRGRKWGQK